MLCHVTPGAHISIWVSVGDKNTINDTANVQVSAELFSFTLKESGSVLFLMIGICLNGISYQERKHGNAMRTNLSTLTCPSVVGEK